MLKVLGIIVAGFIIFWVIRKLEVPKSQTERLAITVWAAFGPYKNSEEAEVSLRRACRAVFGSDGMASHINWVEGHIKNFRDWQAENRFQGSQKLMRFGLSLTSYGKDFNAACKAYKIEALEEAIDLNGLSEAAEQGDVKAQLQLGAMHGAGRGTSINYREAIKWFKKAAEQGNAEAQHGLGLIYYESQSTYINYREAIKWFKKAAEQNYTEAQFKLGSIYYQGHGTPVNYQEALKWYQKAAERGDVNAQWNLGCLYAGGKGTPVDFIKGYAWISLAISQGIKAAKKHIDLLTKTMTPEQIAQARKEATKLWEKMQK